MNDHDAAQTVESGLTWDDVSEEEKQGLTEVFGPEENAMPDKKEEYTAQCWGGPEHGNLISATVKEWEYIISTTMYLDGPGKPPTQNKTIGWYRLVPYVFSSSEGRESMVWNWVGPGADGDTIERMRKI